MQKRLFSLILCLSMLISLFPTIGVVAKAASDIPLGTYTSEDYGSSVTFKADQTFSFVINFGEGFATVTGTYSTWNEDDGGITATLKVTSKHTGIVVSDTYNFSGIPKEDGKLYLTDGSAGIIPADTAFLLKKVTGSSGPTDAQIATGRVTIAAAVKSKSEQYAAAHKTAVASGHTYIGYRGAALDSWAVKEVGIADSMNLMPTEVNDYFQEPITRGDFAALVHSALLRLTGMTESQLKAAVTLGSFPDSSDDKVKVCAGLGIITGYDTGKFLPDKTITRQEAAAMLSRLAETIGAKATSNASSFYDVSGLWGESAIKNVSTLKDGYTGNAVMGGTGANCFSPFDSYSREQALVTIVRMVGVSAGGTSDSAKTGGYEAVSTAVEDKVDALGADGTLSDADIKAIFDYTETLKDQGLIKNLVADGGSITYTTADGIPCGIVIDRQAEDGEATLGSGVAEAPATISLASSGDHTYLANKKVLFITSFAENDAQYYNDEMKKGIQAIRDKGYSVTVQSSASLAQFEKLGSGDYGMIFIYAHGNVILDEFCLSVNTDTTGAYEKYLLSGELRLIDSISVKKSGAYEVFHRYALCPGFFSNNLKNDPLDHAYVQFLSCNSMKNQSMANVFLANGAKAVSGYSDVVQVSYAAKVLNKTAEKLSPAAEKPDGKELTVGELKSDILKTLGLNAFSWEKFDIITRTTTKIPMITRFDAAGAENMVLAVNNGSGTAIGTGLTVSGSYNVSKGVLGLYNYHIVATVTNNTKETLTRIDLCWEDYLGQPTSKRYPDSAIGYGVNNNTDFALKPGESYSFEKTIERLYDKDYFAILIPSYYVGDDKVEIPASDYKLFPLTKAG